MQNSIGKRYNVYQKGDVYYHIHAKTSFSSRLFIDENAALIAQGIYNTLMETNDKVSVQLWETFVRATLNMIDSPSKW